MVYQFYAKAHRPDALCSNDKPSANALHFVLAGFGTVLPGSDQYCFCTLSVLYLYSNYTVSTVFVLCLCSIYTLSVLYLYTSCTRAVLYLLYLYSICVQSILSLYSICTVSTVFVLYLYCMYCICTVPVFYLYSIYTLSVLYLYLICTLSILYLVGYDRIEPRWDRMDKLRLRSAGIGVSWDWGAGIGPIRRAGIRSCINSTLAVCWMTCSPANAVVG